MEIIIIGGFARSGKTETLKYLQDIYGYSVYSSSKKLHQVAAKLLNLHTPKIPVEEFAEMLKDKENGSVVFGNKEYESREFLIKIAEGILVPSFSRNLFPGAIIWELLNERPARAVIETIGGEEWSILRSELDLRGLVYKTYNIRSVRERPSVDYRKLIEGAPSINNDGSSLKDLYRTIDQTLCKSLLSV